MNMSTKPPSTVIGSFRLAATLACGLLGLCGIAAAAGTDSTATPAPGRELHRVVVSIKDLDLNDDRDLATLYHRINAATREVCPLPDEEILKAAAMVQQCRRYAMARAVQAINSPRLTAIVRQHGSLG